MRSTTKPVHLKLAYERDAAQVRDRLRETADSYVTAFRDLVAEFLAFEKVDDYLIETSFGFVDGQPRLDISLRQSSEDLIAGTKIFAAVNATNTYLRLKMDRIELGSDRTFGDVLVEVEFVEPAPASRPSRRRLTLVATG
jgi:hypothetical protein